MCLSHVILTASREVTIIGPMFYCHIELIFSFIKNRFWYLQNNNLSDFRVRKYTHTQFSKGFFIAAVVRYSIHTIKFSHYVYTVQVMFSKCTQFYNHLHNSMLGHWIVEFPSLPKVPSCPFSANLQHHPEV